MSTKRYTKTGPVKRNRLGQPLCRWCGKVVKPPRRTICSSDCEHEYTIRCNPSYARNLVQLRDKCICAICGVNAGFDWDMDHIIPVAAGGGECGLENLRTLCRACHKKETAKLVKRLTEKRRNILNV